MAISIRPMEASDVPAARKIISMAFGTFLGVPEPETYNTDIDYAGPRLRADPTAAFVAEVDGELVGSNFATRWGSVAFFGPLTIRPDFWDRGIGKQLIEPVVECFDSWGVPHAGLFTLPHSAKHVGLYQRYGFWPRSLTAIMSRPVRSDHPASGWLRYSASGPERRSHLDACRRLTHTIFEGLALDSEIRSVDDQDLGDTVLIVDDDPLAGFAVCQCGAGTVAGAGQCIVKFGAVRSGDGAAGRFGRLLDACEDFAREAGMLRLIAGVDTARHRAYRIMLERGFRTDILGLTMHRPNAPGYDREDVYVVDDWR